MSVRAGILVTGTEVITARIVDRNGPWLSERLAELGIEVAHTATARTTWRPGCDS
jgi:nicotinamide-nucleotide amidase